MNSSFQWKLVRRGREVCSIPNNALSHSSSTLSRQQTLWTSINVGHQSTWRICSYRLPPLSKHKWNARHGPQLKVLPTMGEISHIRKTDKGSLGVSSIHIDWVYRRFGVGPADKRLCHCPALAPQKAVGLIPGRQHPGLKGNPIWNWRDS